MMIINHLLGRFKKSDVAKDTLWLFVLQGVDRLVPLFVVPYLMIVLGAEKYGYIGLSMAAVQYVILFVDFGFNFSASKRIAIGNELGKSEVNKIVSATFLAKVILFIISVPILLFIVYYVTRLKVYFVTVICMLPMALGSIFNASWLFQGLGKIRINAIITSICKCCIFPLVFLFVKENKDYNIAALIQSGVYLVAGIISFLVVIFHKWVSFKLVSWKELRLELSESFPLFLSAAAGSTYTQLFTIILGVTSSTTAVGTYSAAERIMRTLCLSIYHPIVTAYYPKLSKLGVESRRKGVELLSKLSKVIATLMLVLGIIMILFSKSISQFIGTSYIGLDRLICIMAVTPFFIALGGVAGQMGLLALGDKMSKKHFRNVYLFAAPLSLLLVSLLAWWFEETGAAIAMVLTELFIFMGMYIYKKKDFKRNRNYE